MKQTRSAYRRRLLLLVPAALLLIGAVSDTTQSILRGFDLIGSVYRQILTEYVEEVSADELLRAGVKGMLSTLDPYAEFIEQRENSEVDALSRGSYGGLGIKVRQRNGTHVVSYIYEEVRPLTNLRIGDVILRVDGVSLADEAVTDLRPLLRGEPGTTVHLVVRRPWVSDSLDLVVRRRKVLLDPLPFAARFNDEILYLRVSRFTKSSADSVRSYLQQAFREGDVRGVIIDLRDNPGGLLEAAVGLVDQFVAPGTPIVSMRGRQPAYARSYRSSQPAISEDVPLAVLVNRRSASASEIVAGALQDLDRAVIIGDRTYGKGLVQTLVPLSHNATLKLTTSRYYIPSGRCIQRLEYRNGATVTPENTSDSEIFYSQRLSRPLLQSNGIRPDIHVRNDTLPAALRCIDEQDAIFHFVVQQINRHGHTAVPEISEAVKRSFREFYDSASICSESALAAELNRLEKHAHQYGLPAEAMRSIDEFRGAFRRSVAAEFTRSWDLLHRMLRQEFIYQLSGERAGIQDAIADDDAIRTARTLLTDPEALENVLLESTSH